MTRNTWFLAISIAVRRGPLHIDIRDRRALESPGSLAGLTRWAAGF